MKTRFIRIKDITDIDTSKVSTYDFNNRYIDEKGNMYGLKYDKEDRKIKIIKLIRTPVKAASYFEKKLVVNKKNELSKGNLDHLSNIDEETVNEENIKDDNDFLDEFEVEFDPDFFIKDTISSMRIHKERLIGIMMNIKNSGVIHETDRINTNQMNDLFRNINIDGIQRIEKVINEFTELSNYPRTVSYYAAKLDTGAKEVFDSLDTDNRRMNFIKYHESLYSFRIIYRTLKNILQSLEYFLDNLNPDENKNLTFADKQHFNDAKVSSANTISEINQILINVKKLEEYTYRPENF